jgi:hypothetical protein
MQILLTTGWLVWLSFCKYLNLWYFSLNPRVTEAHKAIELRNQRTPLTPRQASRLYFILQR